MPDPVTLGGPTGEPSPLDFIPGLATVGETMAGRFVMMSGDMLNPILSAFAATHTVIVRSKPFDLETLDRTLKSVGGVQPRG